MSDFIETLAESKLFAGVAAQDISSMIKCLSAQRRNYAKNEFILHVGDSTSSIGLLLSGGLHIVREDFWGNRNINAELEPGDVFAETFACVPNALSTVDVITTLPSGVLFLDVRRALTTCSSACAFHAALIRNLITVLAANNLRMTEKLSHVTQRSTREKLLSYLSSQASRRASSRFDIPFNRQQLADYLAVDRSALSSELGRMRDEGLITFDKNHFELFQRD